MYGFQASDLQPPKYIILPSLIPQSLQLEAMPFRNECLLMTVPNLEISER